MGHKIAEDEDWEPGEDVKRARRELREARLWLAAQEKVPAPSVPETPPKEPAGHQPVADTPRGERAASVGQEGNSRGSPIATQEVSGGTPGAGDREASPLVKAGGRRVPKVVQDDQTEHPLIGGAWEGMGAVRKGGEIRIAVSAPQLCAA
jgi:hypothetical protein